MFALVTLRKLRPTFGSRTHGLKNPDPGITQNSVIAGHTKNPRETEYSHDPLMIHLIISMVLIMHFRIGLELGFG